MRSLSLAAAVVLMSAAVAVSQHSVDKGNRDARIIAAISTWTQLSFVTTTTTMWLTCGIATQITNSCRKRKLRHMNSKVQMLEYFKLKPTVDSSLADKNIPDYRQQLPMPSAPDQDEELTDKEDDEATREGRLALTVWSSYTSTYTMTMTSVNSASTFSLSFMCTISGASYPPACG